MKIPLRTFFFAACLLPSALRAQVVINEFAYDDAGTDDREFIELFNAGAAVVDLSGWVLGAYDQNGTANPTTTLPAGATIQPGGFYVVANSPVLNVDHIVNSNYLENDQEVILLRNAGGVLVDAVAYETNKGLTFVTGSTGAPADSAAVAAQVGPGIFGNHQCSDIAGAPSSSLGRFVDGRDTNNNGRDFGLRVATPGTANTSGGVLTDYAVPDPASEAPGNAMANMGYSFVPSRVIDPTVVETNNPNAITPPWGPGSKAWVAWDPSGGGNAVSSGGHFPTIAASFRLRAWLETTDLPVQVNNLVPPGSFRGSEITGYGLGCGDALANLTDLDGSIGLSPATLPASESGNGFTGIAWVYERVGAASTGGPISEKLYLVDANDGGDSDVSGNTPLDWTILAVYDLSATAPGWHDLSISIDASGNGTASYDGQSTAFTTSGLHSSAFHVDYRENLQQGADLTPDSMMRPPTFTLPSLPIADLAFAPPTPGARNFTIPVAPGQTIGIEYSTTLQAGSWLDLGNVTVAAGTGSFSDTDAGRLAAFRGFYRAFLR